ncbi:hypothetical protein EZV62_015060 [Acer yangbiense]|uniref:Uncharacterized protein n=1 Tax=Acer yangbiense TaxID=1000413 RepID=A0A5C7HTP1_9ROSI|nr:hypothetical protein EZV62_015060 [Acer yangbiense]
MAVAQRDHLREIETAISEEASGGDWVGVDRPLAKRQDDDVCGVGWDRAKAADLESESLRKTRKLESYSDMAADSSSNVKKISSDDRGEKIDQRSRDEITWQKKIEEIFGTEEEVLRPKKRRYRSLVSIYRATKPIFR